MKAVELFVVFGAGYVSGLSIASGFIFQAIRKFNQSGWTKGKEAAWTAAAMVNIAVGGLMPIFLMALVVFGKPDFWPRASLFACGIAAGGALVFFGVQQINKGVRSLPGRGA